MNRYSYKGSKNGKLYYEVNTGKVADVVKAKQENRVGLDRFLHQALGVMNFTSIEHEVSYELVEQSYGYSIHIYWISTKLKTNTTKEYIQHFELDGKPLSVKTEWRQHIVRYIQGLVSGCQLISYSVHKVCNQRREVSLYCEIAFAALEADQDEEIDYTLINTPYEPISAELKTRIPEIMKHYGERPAQFLEMALPYLNQNCLLDVLISLTYTYEFDEPEKAYPLVKRAVNHLHQEEALQEYEVIVVSLLSELERLYRGNFVEAIKLSERSITLGNEEPCLTLAYMYLIKHQNHQKLRAKELAIRGAKYLMETEEVISPDAAHIIACVALWNKDFEMATQYDTLFLSLPLWMRTAHKLAWVYISMAVAIQNSDFLDRIMQHYPKLPVDFPHLYRIWLHEEDDFAGQEQTDAFRQEYRLVCGSRELYDL